MAAKKARPASVEEEGVETTEEERLASPEATVSRVTLEKTIDRVSRFLSGVAAVRAIRFRLQTRGWSREAMEEGRSLLMALLAWASIRRYVVTALLALSLGFAAWGLDSYFMKTSPHWGQRETMLAYYDVSRDIPGPVVAYQMNWKGENFYTGNHVPAFVSSGKKFQDYVAEELKKGTKTIYFMTEPSRTGTLQNEIGTTKSFEKLTPPELNNKFLLVRAVFE